MKEKVATVNVLEIIENLPHQILSFNDSVKGNKEAEKVFKKLANENGAKDKYDMDVLIEDGLFEEGTYGVYLIHSS